MSPIRPTSLCVKLVYLSLIGCGAEKVGPTARIDLTPDSMCEGAADTAVIVSGKRSVGIGDSDELSYAWTFSRPPAQVLRGGMDDNEIAVEFSTEVAVQIGLRVTDEDGRAGVREQILGLTRAARMACGAGCEPHEICVPFASVELCVDDLECAEDEECGCLVCVPDDLGSRRCVAP
jgi:hypothetical protein